MKQTALSILLMLLPMVASADADEIDGIYYNLVDKARTAEVTYNPNRYSNDVVIPSSMGYDGKTFNVTGIGSDAFENCSGLTSLIIPNNVTSIGNYAFAECSKLQTVKSLIETPFEINDNVFPTDVYNNAKLIVPDGTSSAYQTLNGWKNFTQTAEIESPKETYAVFNNGVLTFYNDNNRSTREGTTFDLNEGSSKPGWYYISISITKVVFDNSFSTALPETTYYWFRGCSNLTEIQGLENMNTANITNMRYMFNNCSKLTNITLPTNLSQIYDYQFSGCSKLSTITIPNTVTSIGFSAFSSCTSLQTASLSNVLETIGDGAFHDCSALSSIEIPASVTTIGSYAFGGCTNMNNFVVNSGNSNYCVIGGVLYTKDKKTLVQYPAKREGSYEIPSTTEKIGYGAFCYSKLSSVVIPSSVADVDHYAFYGCSKLQTVKSLIEAPFEINDNVFPSTVYTNAKLIVPDGTSSTYQATNGWKNFVQIVEPSTLSIAFRPDTYFGGIQGAYDYSYNLKNEKIRDNWHYFELADPKVEPQRYRIAESGYANYYVNPVNVDLSNFKVEFYSWSADIMEPVVSDKNESTRAAGDKLISEVYNNTDVLIEKGFFKEGILKVPFKANIDEIRNRLAKKTGTIFSLQLSRTDSEEGDIIVTSDNAIIYPVVYEQLLIVDKSFYDKNATVHNDIIDVDGTKADSYHLHRNFSYLANATVPATHSVYYKESLNISELLETHYLDMSVNIVDTADTHRGKASWNQYPGDSDASVLASNCHYLSPKQLEDLGLYYDVHLVDYVLGTNTIGESVYMQISQNEKGEFIVTPRNVRADGTTIENEEANASAVGRMPIICIELKDKNNGDRTVTFAWMKIRISDMPEKKQLYINDVSAYRGTQVTLPIQLDNTKSIAGFQFDVTLPEGVQYVKCEKTSRMSSHSVSTNKLSDNKIRFLVSVIGEQEIAIGTGTVLNLTVSIPATYTAGNYTVTVSNIELTHNEGNNVETINQSDATSKLTVVAAKPGDANGDNKVSVTDVTSIINYILQKIPSTFIFEAADVNGDKKISVTDVTMTINIVLGKTGSNARRRDGDNENEPE